MRTIGGITELVFFMRDVNTHILYNSKYVHDRFHKGAKHIVEEIECITVWKAMDYTVKSLDATEPFLRITGFCDLTQNLEDWSRFV